MGLCILMVKEQPWKMTIHTDDCINLTWENSLNVSQKKTLRITDES